MFSPSSLSYYRSSISHFTSLNLKQSISHLRFNTCYRWCLLWSKEDFLSHVIMAIAYIQCDLGSLEDQYKSVSSPCPRNLYELNES